MMILRFSLQLLLAIALIGMLLFFSPSFFVIFLNYLLTHIKVFAMEVRNFTVFLILYTFFLKYIYIIFNCFYFTTFKHNTVTFYRKLGLLIKTILYCILFCVVVMLYPDFSSSDILTIVGSQDFTTH